jgi:hypothetical protein
MEEPVGSPAQDPGDDLDALESDIRVIDDWLSLMKGEELPADRAVVYVDLADDSRHSGALRTLIRHAQGIEGS